MFIDLNKHFTKNTQMSNNCIKKSSPSLAIREMQVKNTFPFPTWPVSSSPFSMSASLFLSSQ